MFRRILILKLVVSYLVDPDHVKTSLKQGLLSILISIAAAAASRKVKINPGGDSKKVGLRNKQRLSKNGEAV